VFQDNAPGACPGQRGARPPPTMARELGRARGWLGVARVLSKEQVARLVDETKELTKKAAGKFGLDQRGRSMLQRTGTRQIRLRRARAEHASADRNKAISA